MLLPFQLNLAAIEEVCGALVTESGDQLVTESSDFIVTECHESEVCGVLVTEDGDTLLTELGDMLVTECFTPEPTIFLHPGRVYKGVYPYWKPRPIEEDEELIILASIEMD